MSAEHAERTIMSFDWALKTILRDKSNFDILEGFLSALLRQDVTILELLESEGNRGEAGIKTNQVDLLVKLATDERVIVEVQYTLEPDFLRRLLFGVAKVITDNLTKGEPYAQVKKVISVSIVHFDVGFNGDNDYVYHGTTEFRGIHSNQLIIREPVDPEYGGISRLELAVESGRTFPEYYIIPVKRFQDIVGDDLDEWIYALKNSQVPARFKARHIDKLRDRLDLLKMPVEERRQYDNYLLRRASDEGVLQLKMKEGFDKGLRQGREEALKEGLQKGRQEERLHIACGLLDVLDDETIVAKTGLAPAVVAQLRGQ
jgi:hypothetical protein